MTLRYTPAAIDDLRRIRDYIGRTLQNPSAASRIVRAVMDVCADLKTFPEMGPSVAAKTGFETDLRMLPCEGFLAFYRVESGAVSVIRVLHGRQDYLHALFGGTEK